MRHKGERECQTAESVLLLNVKSDFDFDVSKDTIKHARP